MSALLITADLKSDLARAAFQVADMHDADMFETLSFIEYVTAEVPTSIHAGKPLADLWFTYQDRKGMLAFLAQARAAEALKDAGLAA